MSGPNAKPTPNVKSSGTHPAWQSRIRAAQHTRNQSLAAAEEDLLNETRDRIASRLAVQADLLRELLSILGIETFTLHNTAIPEDLTGKLTGKLPRLQRLIDAYDAYALVGDIRIDPPHGIAYNPEHPSIYNRNSTEDRRQRWREDRTIVTASYRIHYAPQTDEWYAARDWMFDSEHPDRITKFADISVDVDNTYLMPDGTVIDATGDHMLANLADAIDTVTAAGQRLLQAHHAYKTEMVSLAELEQEDYDNRTYLYGMEALVAAYDAEWNRAEALVVAFRAIPADTIDAPGELDELVLYNRESGEGVGIEIYKAVHQFQAALRAQGYTITEVPA